MPGIRLDALRPNPAACIVSITRETEACVSYSYLWCARSCFSAILFFFGNWWQSFGISSANAC
eukprot:12930909-Prorocentrum_lima.AAC.1